MAVAGLRYQRIEVMSYVQRRPTMAIQAHNPYAGGSSHSWRKSTNQHPRNEHHTHARPFRTSLGSDHRARLNKMSHHHPRNQRLCFRTRPRNERQDRPRQRYGRATRINNKSTQTGRKLHDAFLGLRIRLPDPPARRQHRRRRCKTRLLQGP